MVQISQMYATVPNTCILYKCVYFAGLIFAVHESTMKPAKSGPLKNFLLYGIQGQLKFGRGEWLLFE